MPTLELDYEECSTQQMNDCLRGDRNSAWFTDINVLIAYIDRCVPNT